MKPRWRDRLKKRWGVDLTGMAIGGVPRLDQRELVSSLKRFEASLREVAASWDALPLGVRDMLGTLTIEFGPEGEQQVPQGDQL